MLIRTVRMTFRSEAVDEFMRLFDESSSRIRGFPGCRHLELWMDVSDPNVMTTFSHWISEEALDAYRESELFRETWGKAKVLFASLPIASSHEVVG